MKLLPSSENLLRVVAEQTNAIGVAFSAGKDSHVTADLCAKYFKRIEGFYLYRIPDLQIIQKILKRAESLWGMRVRPYPHFDLTRCFRNAILQPHWQGLDRVPSMKMVDIENQFREDANVEWIAYGWRQNDSRSRALILRANRGLDPDAKRVFPIRSWSRKNVLAYLAARRIPTPPGLGRKDQGGMDFHAGALGYVRDRYPEDFKKILEMFPFAGIQLVNVAKEKP